MSGPRDLRLLVHRLRELRSIFLPAPHPMGQYSSADYDRTSALVLLMHAEIEWFLEERCREVAGAVVASWNADLVPRTTIVALAAFCHTKGAKALSSPGQGPTSIRTVISEAKVSYSATVYKNNG